MNKIIFGLVLGSVISISSCKPDKNIQSSQVYKNPLPGIVTLTVTPQTGQTTNLTFSITNGTPYNFVECRYAITDYTTQTPTHFPGLFLYKFLDKNGASTFTLPNIQCSNGSSSAFIEWNCQNALPPNTQAYITNVEGNSFFFNCP